MTVVIVLVWVVIMAITVLNIMKFEKQTVQRIANMLTNTSSNLTKDLRSLDSNEKARLYEAFDDNGPAAAGRGSMADGEEGPSPNVYNITTDIIFSSNSRAIVPVQATQWL